MDSYEFILILLGIALAGFLVWRYMMMKDNHFRTKMISDSRKHNKNIKIRQQEAIGHVNMVPEGEVGSWVPDLLEGLGLDPDSVFDDEMPPEIQKFMPMIKGFMDKSGGIAGIAEKISGKGGDDQWKGL